MWPLRCNRRKLVVFRNVSWLCFQSSKSGLLLDIYFDERANVQRFTESVVFRIANLDLDPAGQETYLLTAEGTLSSSASLGARRHKGKLRWSSLTTD